MHRIDFNALFEVLPSPHNIVDRDLKFVAVNSAYEQATGRSRDELIGRGMFEAFPNPGEAGRRLRDSLESVLSTGEPDTLAFIHYEIPLRDGRMEDRYWSAVHMPIRGPDGTVEFVLQNTVDVTDWQKAQAAAALPLGATPVGTELLQRAKEAERAQVSAVQAGEEFKRLFRQAPGFIAVLTGESHVFTFANDAYLKLIGGRQAVGRTVAQVLPEVVGQGFIDLLDRVRSSGEPVGMTGAPVLLEGEDGTLSQRFVDFTYQPIFDGTGGVSGIFVQGGDRTNEVRAAERQKLLVDELNHRVKNSLATVQSIAAQTLRSTPDPAAFREAFEARIMALSMVHNLLTGAGWEGADLRAVLTGELTPHGADRSSLEGPAVQVSAQEALSLALVIHELATNAAKYGALSRAEGQVAVRWQVAPHPKGRRLTLSWIERGGPPVTAPSRRGFGSRLIERTASHELGGQATSRFAPDGLELDLELMLES